MARGRALLKTPRQHTIQDRQSGLPETKDAERVRDWATLVAGEKVCIVQENGSSLTGQVDAVTRDGAILWLHLAAGAGRRLFPRSEGGLVSRVTAGTEGPA